jgi:tetratricopeptide (TPR) repeat protein
MHRTLNRDPKGKGWVECGPGFEGFWCKPDRVKEAIEYFKIAYEVFPDIVALNQIALAYETLGEYQLAADFFERMKEQAQLENNDAYIQAADLGLGRCE